ncbi:hypothetical protein C8R43DRAFT_1109660 [Mycena crocata]|nr:hypothetical protein C8R43DRAFT_1109660 [Mycena crocata]
MSGIPDEDGINSSWREQRARGTEGICGQCNLCCYVTVRGACHFDNVKIQHGTDLSQALSTALEPVHLAVSHSARAEFTGLTKALRSSSSRRRRHQLIISSPTTEWRYGLAAAGSLSHYAYGRSSVPDVPAPPQKIYRIFRDPANNVFVQGRVVTQLFGGGASAFKLNVAQCRADRRRGAPLRIFFLQFLEFPQAGIIFKVLNSRPGRAAEARSADTANFIQVFVWFLDITTCEVSYSLPRISGFPLSGLTRQSDLNTQGGGAAALQKIRSLYAPPPPENNVASVDGAERRPPNFDSMFGLPANKVTRCSFNDPARNANLIFGVPASGRLRAQLSTTPRFNQVKNAPNQLPLAQLPFKNEHIDLAISNIFAFNNAFLHASSWISSSPNSRTRRMFNFSLTTRQEFNYNKRGTADSQSSETTRPTLATPRRPRSHSHFHSLRTAQPTQKQEQHPLARIPAACLRRHRSGPCLVTRTRTHEKGRMVCLPAFRNSAQNAFAPRSREREARKKKRKNQEESEKAQHLPRRSKPKSPAPRKKSKEKENARREKNEKKNVRMQHPHFARLPPPPSPRRCRRARPRGTGGRCCLRGLRTNELLACIYAKNKTGENEWTGRQEGEERLLWPATSPISPTSPPSLRMT